MQATIRVKSMTSLVNIINNHYHLHLCTVDNFGFVDNAKKLANLNGMFE
ncbi:hypothetical protein PALB_24850 [Pseudoalteromonas luteoviolacea B = ATCC 29581]|nr:hypothetical protein PALB_24850 [Pseudoalteromonas luteoviolacea B = ATCC 29581]